MKEKLLAPGGALDQLAAIDLDIKYRALTTALVRQPIGFSGKF